MPQDGTLKIKVGGEGSGSTGAWPPSPGCGKPDGWGDGEWVILSGPWRATSDTSLVPWSAAIGAESICINGTTITKPIPATLNSYAFTTFGALNLVSYRTVGDYVVWHRIDVNNSIRDSCYMYNFGYKTAGVGGVGFNWDEFNPYDQGVEHESRDTHVDSIYTPCQWILGADIGRNGSVRFRAGDSESSTSYDGRILGDGDIGLWFGSNQIGLPGSNGGAPASGVFLYDEGDINLAGQTCQQLEVSASDWYLQGPAGANFGPGGSGWDVVVCVQIDRDLPGSAGLIQLERPDGEKDFAVVPGGPFSAGDTICGRAYVPSDGTATWTRLGVLNTDRNASAKPLSGTICWSSEPESPVPVTSSAWKMAGVPNIGDGSLNVLLAANGSAEWHTADNSEPPPPGGTEGDGGVEPGWAHVSWMRSKSGGPGSGRTGRLKIKVDDVFVDQPICTGTWTFGGSDPEPFPTGYEVRLGSSGAIITGYDFRAQIAGGPLIYLESSAPVTVWPVRMVDGDGVEVPRGVTINDRWWVSAPQTWPATSGEVRDLANASTTSMYSTSNNDTGFVVMELKFDPPGVVTKVCVAGEYQIS